MGTDFVPTGIANGLSGSVFSKATTTVVVPGAGGAFLPAAGLYYAYGLGAGIVMEVLDDSGAWNLVGLAGQGQMFCSDGVNLRFRNTAGGNQNVVTIKVG